MDNRIRFGSVCSGIEAASVAWLPLGWECAWVSEIEKFPSAVLAHHYPDVPNLGDMLALDPEECADIDVLVGGTPCQSFSVAGLRKGLDDDRGNLTLSFVRLAEAIDAVRLRRGQPPITVVWENVPGVFSHGDNPFGCLLAGLAGEDDPLVPSGERWTHAGCVLGPTRTIGWRVLDAQHFGLAQRRKRVFVIASARPGIDPREILFEPEGVLGDHPAGQEAGKETPGEVAVCLGGGRAGERGWRNDLDTSGDECQNLVGTFQNTGQGWWNESEQGQAIRAAQGGGTHEANVVVEEAKSGDDKADPITAQEGRTYTHEGVHNFRLHNVVEHPVAFKPSHYTRDKDGAPSEVVPPLTADADKGDQDPIILDGEDNPDNLYVTPRIIRNSFTSNQVGIKFDGKSDALCSDGPGGVVHPEEPIPFDTTQITHPENRSRPEPGDKSPSLAKGSHHPSIAFTERTRAGGRTFEMNEDQSYALTNPGEGGRTSSRQILDSVLRVRRLMPVECERLQGFPDHYTLIDYSGRASIRKVADDVVKFMERAGFTLESALKAAACPDGPRYMSLGNSMAVPVMRWIGERLDVVLMGGRRR